MKCQFASFSGLGGRKANEDSLSIQNYGRTLFAAVADGVGGHAGGQEASQIVTDILGSKLSVLPFCQESLEQAVCETGQILCNTPDAGLSTLAAVWIEDYHTYAAHVGDSRIYQFRGNEIVYQSVDHSIVGISVSLGDLQQQDIRNHKDRSKLYRVLGDPSSEPIVDCVCLEVLPGDRFLLCSDGFWEPVTELDMAQACSESATMEQWMVAMQQLIGDQSNPSQDNYTAICLELL